MKYRGVEESHNIHTRVKRESKNKKKIELRKYNRRIIISLKLQIVIYFFLLLLRKK